jgi:pimeloyl-ACP methyl ester carboxylesterase
VARALRKAASLAAAGALTATGLAAAGVGTSGPAAAGAGVGSAPKIVWGDCTSASLLAINAECGLLSVPLDHAKPAGKKIQIAVSRVKALVPANQRQGIMLGNPGGPGGSGLSMAALRDVVPDGAGRSYDWIGFDPRGVGESKPAISCVPDYYVGPRPDYTPQHRRATLSPAEKAWLARSKSYAQACGRKHGELLKHMRTVDMVRDMDLIRAAFGEKKINYYGYSWGTYLGQAYATMFPGKVRRMVFDGNVDPRGVWYAAQLEQDKAFEKVIQRFFAWTAKWNKVYKLGATPAAVRDRYYAELAKLRAKPVDGIGPAEWGDAFLRAGYAESLWPQTASAFAAAARDGDFTLLKLAYEMAETPGDDNGFAVYNAVQCTDAPWPRDYVKGWRADGFATAAKAPFMTWGNVWYNTPCIYWPAPAGKPLTIDGSKAPAILLVNTTGDGATPYRGALHVRKLFPKSRLVAEKGTTTHSNSLNGNMCVDNVVAAYLATGKLPVRKAGDVADRVCPPSEAPDPGPAELAYAEQSQDGARPADETPDDGPAPSKSERYPQYDLSVLRQIIGLLP